MEPSPTDSHSPVYTSFTPTVTPPITPDNSSTSFPTPETTAKEQAERPSDRKWTERFEIVKSSLKTIAGGALTMCTFPSTLLIGLVGAAGGALVGLGKALYNKSDFGSEMGSRGFFEEHRETITSNMTMGAVAGGFFGSLGGLALFAMAKRPDDSIKDVLKEWADKLNSKLSDDESKLSDDESYPQEVIYHRLPTSSPTSPSTSSSEESDESDEDSVDDVKR